MSSSRNLLIPDKDDEDHDDDETDLYRSCGFGLVGTDEKDESHFDSRHRGVAAIEDDNDDDDCTDAASSTSSMAAQHHNDGRLSFSQKKLYGRQAELNKLVEIYQNNNNKKQVVVFLSGYSGCGKTRLFDESIAQFQKASSRLPLEQQQQQQQQQRQRQQEQQQVLVIIRGKYEEPSSQQQQHQGEEGKVHQHHRHNVDPYKGISDAFGQWYTNSSSCLSIEQKRSLQRHFLQELDHDAAVLVGMIIPAMRNLLRGYDDDDDGGSCRSSCRSDSADTTTDNSIEDVNKSRIQSAFHAFLKCLCMWCSSELSSALVILFMDDLQWADVQSLELITSLLLLQEDDDDDSSSSDDHRLANHFLFVGAFRSNEVQLVLPGTTTTANRDDEHPLASMIHDLKNDNGDQQQKDNDSSSSNNNIEMMEILGLKKPDVGEFIGDTLGLSAKEVMPLTEAIYSKTAGNMFFTMQALEQLVRRNALYYDMIVFRWQWVANQQLQDLLSTTDIKEVVRTKISRMPDQLQKTLVAASQIRSTFDIDTLIEVVVAAEMVEEEQGSSFFFFGRPPPTRDTLVKLLDQAVYEGLLIRNNKVADHAGRQGADSYTFVHDQIRQAAGSLLLDEEEEKSPAPASRRNRDRLSLQIGTALAKRGFTTSVGEDWMLFMAAHHLNAVPRRYYEDSEEKLLNLARLNLETARLSMAVAAFDQAAHYSECGIGCLPSTSSSSSWKHQHGHLYQELYVTAAEASRLVGDVERMETYCNELLSQKGGPLLDESSQFQANLTLAMGLFYGTDRYTEARSIILNLLRQLGCRFPKRSVPATAKTISLLIKLVATKKKRTGQELERLELMTDPDKIKCMKLLNFLFAICYLMNDEIVLPLLIFRSLEYTLNFGVSIYSPRIVAAVCIFFAGALNDLQGAALYANYSLQLMKKVNNHRPIVSGTILFSYSFGLYWTLPVRDILVPIKKAHVSGTETGDFENATWCIFQYLSFSFQAGSHLVRLETEFAHHAAIMEETSWKTQGDFTKMWWRIVLRLMGRPSDHLSLGIDEQDSDKALRNLSLGVADRIALTYYGDHEPCADSAVKVGDAVRKAAAGHPLTCHDMLVCALSCVAAARSTGKSAYKREAKRRRAIVNTWVKQGNQNARHWKVLLDAEFAALQRQKPAVVIKTYESALAMATEGRYIQDAALANERWGEFALDVLSDQKEAARRLKEALRLFREWGALGKVERMKEKYADCFSTQS